jgi:uncharacterized protein
MNTENELWLFGVSLGASALGGMLGMASGIFIVPVLTMFGHVDIRGAIGASIVSVIACLCSSDPRHTLESNKITHIGLDWSHSVSI